MITVTDLYYIFPDGSVGLSDISLKLPGGSRSLLLGANGAGKSTLLRVVSGKTLAKNGSVLVDNKDPFRESLVGTTYLGTEWANNSTVKRDMPVTLLISSVGGDAYPDRRDELVDILDIDLRWHMNAISDGERRRVQLCMGLLRPWTTLLLDEVTVDLDVLVRTRLLAFLQQETEIRGCQIVYATHIFDGLMGWPTHIVHMHLGTVAEYGPCDDILAKYATQGTHGTPLLELALRWLKEDLERRGQRADKQKWNDIAPKVGAYLDHGDNFNSYFSLTRGRR